MNDYLESRLGIKGWLERLKTPEGKKFLYVCIVFFVFVVSTYIFSDYFKTSNKFREEFEVKYPLMLYAEYFLYFSIGGLFITAGLAMWYHKHVWKEPLFVDLIIPRKYGGLIWMIIGLVCIGTGIFCLFILPAFQTIMKGSLFSIGLIVVGILLFLYGYK